MVTRNLCVSISQSSKIVYQYASDPARLHEWASGLAGKPLECIDNQWFSESPMGRVRVDFVDENEFGVLDHLVTLPNGESVLNPVRVIPSGERASEVVFTLRQRDMTDDEFEADTQHVMKDLQALKKRLE